MFLRKSFAIWLLVLWVGSIQGCYTLNQVGSPTQEVIELTNADNAAIIDHFKRSKKVSHFLYGLINPHDEGIEKIVSEAVRLAGGSKAVNVRFKYQMTFGNGLLNAITVGIYNPFTLTVEGDVVK